jgi:VWFA-related protein
MLSPLMGDRSSWQESLGIYFSRSTANCCEKAITSMIALAYAQESLHLARDRTALVVITDGLGRQHLGEGNLYYEPSPPDMPFAKLRSAVEELPVVVYPILLRADVTQSPWNKNLRGGMQQLADASGGRLFKANSPRDLVSVYAQVAEELRSVYTIGYYPQNQNFDGKYRRIQVKVKRPGLTLRTRPGYYAW